MYVSEGFGFMGLFPPPIMYVASIRLFRAIYGVDYMSTHALPGALGLLAAAAFEYRLSVIFNKPPGRYRDPKTGKSTPRTMRHRLFKMKLEYIAGILVLGALAMLFFKTGSPG